MKKRNLLYIGCALLMTSLYSCDDFLTRDPQDKQTNDTFWQSETSLRTYAQDFYSAYFKGYGTDYVTFAGYFSGDDYTDDFLNITDANTNKGGYIYFPTSSTTDWNSLTSTWKDNYSIVYKANAMLEKIPGMNITEEAKNHWMGVARFFRAMAYSAMAKVYGGVPYIDRVIDPNDDVILYKDRDPYLFVAQKIQEDYQYALENVRTDDTKRQVNKYVVGAYMSRDMLYHATWLKYHGTTVGPTSEKVIDGDIKNLLQGSINGAEIVMNSGKFRIGNAYNAIFSTDDLASNAEVIWYREYTTGVQGNALMSYNAVEEQTQGGITNDVVESYLCSDGLPIGQSSLYKGKDNPSISISFQDRDPRLYQTIPDSLRLAGVTGVAFKTSTSPTGYATKKFLNDEWYAAGSEFCTSIKSPADAPCIRYAEVLLNYVEARYELSKVGGTAFTQSDLDKSINEIRKRQLIKWGEKPQVARVLPKVQLNGSNLSVNGTVINDPVRDPQVDAILWEIRRERRIELIVEGRRGEDLRRWAKFEYLNSEETNGNPDKSFLGAYIRLSDYPTMVTVNKAGEKILYLYDPKDPTNVNAQQGYVKYIRSKNARAFKKGELDSERYYLRSIPDGQMTTYKDKDGNKYKLTQNPGW